jgi:hypothetical protein
MSAEAPRPNPTRVEQDQQKPQYKQIVEMLQIPQEFFSPRSKAGIARRLIEANMYTSADPAVLPPHAENYGANILHHTHFFY